MGIWGQIGVTMGRGGGGGCYPHGRAGLQASRGQLYSHCCVAQSPRSAAGFCPLTKVPHAGPEGLRPVSPHTQPLTLPHLTDRLQPVRSSP